MSLSSSRPRDIRTLSSRSRVQSHRNPVSMVSVKVISMPSNIFFSEASSSMPSSSMPASIFTIGTLSCMLSITSSGQKGMGCTIRPPPALTLPSWGSTRTPRYTIEGCCSLTVKYCAKSSAISPDTILLLPT